MSVGSRPLFRRKGVEKSESRRTGNVRAVSAINLMLWARVKFYGTSISSTRNELFVPTLVTTPAAINSNYTRRAFHTTVEAISIMSYLGAGSSLRPDTCVSLVRFEVFDEFELQIFIE